MSGDDPADVVLDLLESYVDEIRSTAPLWVEPWEVRANAYARVVGVLIAAEPDVVASALVRVREVDARVEDPWGEDEVEP